jgi:putative SOS response-associated peptidase YedK
VCGRFALFALPEVVAEYFALGEPPAELAPRYNLTPGQAVAAVREHDGRRELAALRWGLVPFWAKEASIGYRLINARAETLAVKPAFREALTRRRCLIPASGFYEWQGTGGGPRQPFFVRPREEPLFAFAGLWERWRDPAGSTLETCVIVTTEAAGALAAIHERMPVLVPRAAHAQWLDPRTSVADAPTLAAAAPALETWPVSRAVNDPRRDDAELIEPLEKKS